MVACAAHCTNDGDVAVLAINVANDTIFDLTV